MNIIKAVDFGVYLRPEGDDTLVLLPKKQVPEGASAGDVIEVFIYKDSSDRVIATLQRPKLTVGESAELTVVQTSEIGAFLEWGLERDLFLPFKEQRYPVAAGDKVTVTLYVDKSERLAATMYTKSRLNNGLREEPGNPIVPNSPKFQIPVDSAKIMKELESNNGSLPFCDKSNPDEIRRRFGMSKKSFKHAVGNLYKLGKIDITDEGISLKHGK